MPWSNWRRQTDFYREGQLLWLAVDMKIRTLSQDRHSIDDFAQRFFGVDNGSFVTRTYTFNEVVSALNAVQPYDWAGFLHGWLYGVGRQVPLLSGIEASGWRLVYTDKPSGYQNALENVSEGELEGKGSTKCSRWACSSITPARSKTCCGAVRLSRLGSRRA